ncbi:MAG TPA: hypothetical protein VMD76_14475 [Candidatus Sulfotelmatobacter sp.]|nr:hypothetical protein [Candidatus Sulfotelmatobacter sp.]
MTMRLFFSELFLSALLFGAASASFSQQLPTPDGPVSPSSAPATSQVAKANARPSRAFAGTIQKAGDQLVLRVLSTQQSYRLDDQDAAERYKGQYVKVIATFDARTNTLHIMDVVPQSSPK